MEYEEVYHAVSAALEDKKPDVDENQDWAPGLFSIEPFDALDGKDNEVRVVGIMSSASGLDFIVIKEDPEAEGEIYPTTESGVFKKPTIN